jgi:hypothetical protein
MFPDSSSSTSRAIRVTDGELMRRHAATERTNLDRNGLRAIRLSVVRDRDVGARTRKLECNEPADAAAATDDQDGASRKQLLGHFELRTPPVA